MHNTRFVPGLLLGLVVVMALAFAAGCSRNPLVGKWTGAIGRTTQDMQFNADGTWSADFANGRASMGGTYKSDQDTFTLKQTHMTVNGVNRPATAAMTAPEVVKYKVDRNTLTIFAGPRSSQLTRVP